MCFATIPLIYTQVEGIKQSPAPIKKGIAVSADSPPSFAKSRIRNIGIMAHIDAGKTTLTERIIFYTGLSRKMGEVHEGSAVMDWMEQEQSRGITISAAATHCLWKDVFVNLIDTPGHVDFTVEVERSLRALDGAVAVFDAVQGVEPQSETVWKQADGHKIPRLCFLNKMDRLGASFEKSLQSIEQKLSLRPVAVQYPVGEEENFQGVLDLVENKILLWKEDGDGKDFSVEDIPPAYKETAREKRSQMLEILGEGDDSLMERYLYHPDVPVGEIQGSLRAQTLSLKLSPVFCGSALKNKAVQPLLDAIRLYLPSPLDVPPAQGLGPKGESLVRRTDDKEPLSALAFKIAFDAFSGALTYIRVYSGEIKSGELLYNVREGKSERAQKILKMHANFRKELKHLRAGDIGALIGLKLSRTGDSLCEKQAPAALAPVSFPDPVLSVALEPKTRADKARLEESLKKLEREDPSCRTRKDKETGQLLLMGMGELHIEILLDRLRKDYKVQARSGRPQVSFREKPSGSWTGERLFDQEIQSVRAFAKIRLKITPCSVERVSPAAYVFHHGEFKRERADILSALKEGLEQALSAGPFMACPVRELEIFLLDMQYGEEPHLEALRSCMCQTLAQGLREAGCLLLEPVFRLQVHCPPAFSGAVTGDLKARRGEIQTVKEMADGSRRICAHAPLTQLFGYATALRSLSQGRAGLSMEMQTYKSLPEKERQKLFV